MEDKRNIITGFIGELAAVCLFASRDDTRYVLNTVAIEANDDKVTFVATDGRRLAALSASATNTNGGKWAVLVPRTAVERILKHTKNGEFRLEVKGGDGVRIVTITTTIEAHVVSIETSATEGNYPNWREVIPKEKCTPTSVIAFNPALLDGFRLAAKLLKVSDKGIGVGMGGKENPARVRIIGAPNFHGVIMPMRIDFDEINHPEWLNLKSTTDANRAECKD